MRSAFEDQSGNSGDLTARARVRDTAIRLFGRDGFRTSVRAIAQGAGVSPGLILHHFQSKDGLRKECDDYVLARIREQKETAITPSSTQQLLMAMASVDESAPLVGYALRSIQAGGDIATSFIDHFAADAEEWIAEGVAAGSIVPSRDEKARARYLTVMGFGTLMLDAALNPPEDSSDFAAVIRGYMERNGLPSAELFTEGLMTDRSMLDAYLLYVTDPPGEPASPEPPKPHRPEP